MNHPIASPSLRLSDAGLLRERQLHGALETAMSRRVATRRLVRAASAACVLLAAGVLLAPSLMKPAAAPSGGAIAQAPTAVPVPVPAPVPLPDPAPVVAQAKYQGAEIEVVHLNSGAPLSRIELVDLTAPAKDVVRLDDDGLVEWLRSSGMDAGIVRTRGTATLVTNMPKGDRPPGSDAGHDARYEEAPGTHDAPGAEFILFPIPVPEARYARLETCGRLRHASMPQHPARATIPAGAGMTVIWS